VLAGEVDRVVVDALAGGVGRRRRGVGAGRVGADEDDAGRRQADADGDEHHAVDEAADDLAGRRLVVQRGRGPAAEAERLADGLTSRRALRNCCGLVLLARAAFTVAPRLHSGRAETYTVCRSPA